MVVVQKLSSYQPSPPNGFKPAVAVEETRISLTPPSFIRPQRYTGRRAEGVRYECRAQEYLMQQYPNRYTPGPWLYFRDFTGWRWCQPDGLLFDFKNGRIIVVEMKYQHTADAWWQLRKLYVPVLQAAFPHTLWKFSVCEVVKWYDPATVFPEQVEMVKRIDLAENFGVNIWKP